MTPKANPRDYVRLTLERRARRAAGLAVRPPTKRIESALRYVRKVKHKGKLDG